MFYRIIQLSVKFYHGKYLEKGCHRTIDVYSCCRNHNYLLIVVMKQVKLYTDWFGCLIDTLKQKDKRAYINELKMYVHTLITNVYLLIKRKCISKNSGSYISLYGRSNPHIWHVLSVCMSSCLTLTHLTRPICLHVFMSYTHSYADIEGSTSDTKLWLSLDLSLPKTTKGGEVGTLCACLGFTYRWSSNSVFYTSVTT